MDGISKEMILLIYLIVLIVTTILLYYIVTTLFPPMAIQRMFMDMYVPPENKESERDLFKITIAFLIFRGAIVLWLFRALCWIIEFVVSYFVVVGWEDLIVELGMYAVVASYTLIVIAFSMLVPHFKKYMEEEKLREESSKV